MIKTNKDKALQKEIKAEARKTKNIKVLKLPISINSKEQETFSHWMKLGKEFYNLLLNQRIAVDKYNTAKYYEHNPEKLAEKEKKEDEYAARVAQEILSGKRLPKKKHDSPFLSPVQKRHAGLQNLAVDVATHCYGASSLEELMSLDDKEIKINKAGIPQIYLSYVDQSRYGTQIRLKCPEFNVMPSPYWMGICHQVDRAFADYTKNKISYMKKSTGKFPKPPKFASYKDDFSLIGASGADNNATVKIVKLSKDRNHRVFGISGKYFPNGLKVNLFKPINGTIISTSIVQEGLKYYLTVSYEEQKVFWPAKAESVGIDLGISRNIQLSDGSFMDLPKERMKFLDKNKRNLQKSLKRMKVNSSNYNKKQKKIAKISKTIAGIRKYYIAMYATEIARNHENVYIENLKVKNMTKSAKGDSETPGKNVSQKSGLNREMLNIAPYMFRLWIENKAKEYGRTVIAVDPKYLLKFVLAVAIKMRKIEKVKSFLSA